MSDPTIPTGGTPPTAPPDPAPTNADFARLRLAQEKAETDRKVAETALAEAQAKLKAFEDANKTELQRLQDEANRAKTLETEQERLRNELGQFQSQTQKLYEDRLASFPEANREALAKLSANGNYAERLELLNAAAALIPSAPPAPFGTGANPANAGTGGEGRDWSKASIGEIENLSWAAVTGANK